MAMELSTFTDTRHAAELADGWCRQKIAATGATSLFVPAGSSVLELYALWEETRPDYLNGMSLVQVDDVSDGPGQGMFLDFLYEQLPSYRDQIAPISATREPAEFAILGFGTNGHVAFHEPGLRDDLVKARVTLSAETVDRLSLPPGTKGLTYGLGAFLQTAAVLLIVAGEGKVGAFRKFLAGHSGLPAAALTAHPDLTVLVEAGILAEASAR